ncbi:MAG: peptidyl-prolyl cis-trans isomerase [Polyangiaceae bacterium]|nr:peptidyl-prolyl cis-trans isomerase [Myxococcales bacterium]MCB9586936.1 peptidyl-prolyl cis-trans isomerase [Polyangiaceae bacterium]MCB9608225.1 peptidyl-prolyl cis-trans isomerase [Polyangiaceae bacterium]
MKLKWPKQRPASADAPEPRVPALELRSTLLLVGMLAGIASMGVGLGKTQRALPPGIAAEVGERQIPESEVDATLQSLRQAGFSQIDRKTVLDRLVDEELLLQEALRLDLHHTDVRLRGALVRDLIDASNAAPVKAPTQAELLTHYSANPARFAPAAQLELETVFFRGPSAADDAVLAVELWRGGTVPRGNAKASLPLPSGLVPVGKWRDYLGRDVSDALSELPEGGISEAFRLDDAWGVAKVKARRAERPPAFAAVEPQVRADYQRRQSEVRLRQLVSHLRAVRAVRVAPERH